MINRFDKVRGVLPALVTPFDEQLRLRTEWLPALFAQQRRAKVDGLVIGGTNGEAASMSVSQRQLLLEEALAIKGDFVIVAGTGASSLADAITLTQHAAQAGADAVLVLPPFFVKNASLEGLENYFRTVLDCADIPMILYAIPQFTAVEISPELLIRLGDHPNLAGVKDSAGKRGHLTEIRDARPDLNFFAGGDYLSSFAFSNGYAGVISGTSNAYPERLVAIRDLKNSNPTDSDWEAAQEHFNEAIRTLAPFPFSAVNKSILASRGLPKMSVLPPLVNLSSVQNEALMIAIAPLENGRSV